MAKAATTATPRPGEMTAKDVQARIDKIRSDISALTSSVKKHGADAASDVKGHADTISSDVAKASEDAISELRHQLDILENDTRGRIRENPLAAVGIAAGIGFLAALLMRR